jgi:glyoxylase-like metal-dependent hydrolase (beta-lactamase superfamily II)
VRIQLVNTTGLFSIDGEDFEVENNVWIVGDDREVVVIDAAHAAPPIIDAVGDRRVRAIVCTHGHNDHINAAEDLQRAVGAAQAPPILLHPADEMLWDAVYPHRKPDGVLAHGGEVSVAGRSLRTIHTPGHSPGGCCLYLPAGDDHGPTVLSGSHVFGGDTLFRGGPGATGRSFSDFPTIIESIRRELLTLPPATIVHTGHGDRTTIGEEAPHLDEWIARGH